MQYNINKFRLDTISKKRAARTPESITREIGRGNPTLNLPYGTGYRP
jgi:hypothetical protein